MRYASNLSTHVCTELTYIRERTKLDLLLICCLYVIGECTVYCSSAVSSYRCVSTCAAAAIHLRYSVRCELRGGLD